jgi:hypothetical protein
MNGEAENGEKGKSVRETEQQRTNALLFWIALGASIFMTLFLSASFFRDNFSMHDVEYGIVSVVLGLITLYAGNNKVLQGRCPEEEKKSRNGEMIFAFIVFWGLIMWGIYQTRITRMFGIEMVLPGHFYTFILGVIMIFGGSRMYEFFSSRKNNNNNNNKRA